MKSTVTIVRLLVGVWMLWNGINHWVHWTPQPMGDKSHYLHLALMQSGLFSIAKLVEIAVGLSLLLNRMVPALLVASFPVTVIIAWMALVIEVPRPAGTILLLTHAFLLFAYLPHLYPMLVWKARPLRSLKEAAALGGSLVDHRASPEPLTTPGNRNS
jgi:hypothetical protein